MRRAVTLLGVLAVAPAAGGCFIELTGGAYPALQTTTRVEGEPTTSARAGALTVGITVGFYLDLFGVGVGVAGVGGQVMHPTGDPDEQVGAEGGQVRLDVDLPLYLRTTKLKARGTGVVDFIAKGTLPPEMAGGERREATGAGHAYFLGGTISTVTRDGTVALSLGPSYLTHQTDAVSDGVAFAGIGAQLRLHVAWMPQFTLLKHYTPSEPIRPLPTRECTVHTTVTCSYGMFGRTCSESSACY